VSFLAFELLTFPLLLFSLVLSMSQDHHNEGECRHFTGQTLAAQQSFKASTYGAVQLTFQLHCRSPGRDWTNLWVSKNTSGNWLLQLCLKKKFYIIYRFFVFVFLLRCSSWSSWIVIRSIIHLNWPRPRWHLW
jgi:hypothetical protein